MYYLNYCNYATYKENNETCFIKKSSVVRFSPYFSPSLVSLLGEHNRQL